MSNARSREFREPHQGDLPCPATPAKTFRFSLTRLISRNLAVLPRQEGRIAIVTYAGRDAVDEAASGTQSWLQGGSPVSDKTACRRPAQTSSPNVGLLAHGRPRCWPGLPVRQNRVVLAPVAGVKSAEARSAQPGWMRRQSADDGDKTNSSPGRARHKPLKPFACGDAGCSGELVVTTVCIFLAHGLRVHRAPGIPHALSLRRAKLSGKARARHAPRVQTRIRFLRIESS
jgi:hypothetical protein